MGIHDSSIESPPALSSLGIKSMRTTEVILKQYQKGLVPLEQIKANNSYFMKAINQIVDMHRKKASDYTDLGEFDNFIESSQSAGIETYQAIENLIGTKEARIRVLRKKEKRDNAIPTNEPLLDSYLDRAVYAIISYAHELMLLDDIKRQVKEYDSPRVSNDPLIRGMQGWCQACDHPVSRHHTILKTGCECCDSQ